jgi:hypothetical protein
VSGHVFVLGVLSILPLSMIYLLVGLTTGTLIKKEKKVAALD